MEQPVSLSASCITGASNTKAARPPDSRAASQVPGSLLLLLRADCGRGGQAAQPLDAWRRRR